MYIDADTIIKAASLLTALSVLVGGVIAVYKIIAQVKRQTEELKSMKEEQTIICYALEGALQGLIENGCNGPCKNALQKLEAYLNQKAHDSN